MILSELLADNFVTFCPATICMTDLFISLFVYFFTNYMVICLHACLCTTCVAGARSD